MKPKMTLKTLVGLAAVLLLLVLFHSYCFLPPKDQFVKFPDGRKFRVHLADVRRVDRNHIRIKMDIFPRLEGCRTGIVIPDADISGAIPFGLLPPRSTHTEVNCDRTIWGFHGVGTRWVSYFELKESKKIVNISQTFYCRKKSDVVKADIPLKQHAMARNGTSRIEILKIGLAKEFASDEWEEYCYGGVRPEDVCVAVDQTCPDGPLYLQTSAAPGAIYVPVGNEPDVSNGFSQLLDGTGNTLKMESIKVHTKSWRRRFLTERKASAGFSLHPLRLYPLSLNCNVHEDESLTHLQPENGKWLYCFGTKDAAKYKKIRIMYIMPPRPEDKRFVHFDGIRI